MTTHNLMPPSKGEGSIMHHTMKGGTGMNKCEAHRKMQLAKKITQNLSKKGQG